MKKIILIFALTTYTFINAQVAIGKLSVDGSGVLDFVSGSNSGLILPIVETLPTTVENGTFLMDKNDLKLKMRENGVWVELSDSGSISGVTFNSNADSAGSKVVIGTTSTTTPGILVLESTEMALILPKVADPHLNVKSPVPGTMCYDTTSKSLALFDGLKWNYWK